MQAFRFDPEAHAYYLGDAQIPGVTAVLSQVVDFRFVDDAVLARKCAIGAAFHAAVQLDHDGELDEDSIDPAVAPYFEGWRKFKHEHRAFELHATERPVFSLSYRYGCTPDIWGRAQGMGGRAFAPFVLELKSTDTVHPAVSLQTAAQARAIAEALGREAAIPGFSADQWARDALRFVLRLTPRGTYSLHQLAGADDFVTFLSLLTAYRWKKRHNIDR